MLLRNGYSSSLPELAVFSQIDHKYKMYQITSQSIAAQLNDAKLFELQQISSDVYLVFKTSNHFIPFQALKWRYIISTAFWANINVTKHFTGKFPAICVHVCIRCCVFASPFAVVIASDQYTHSQVSVCYRHTINGSACE